MEVQRESLLRIIEGLTRLYESDRTIATAHSLKHSSSFNGDYADQQFWAITIVSEDKDAV